jgi:hypothetical protein
MMGIFIPIIPQSEEKHYNYSLDNMEYREYRVTVPPDCIEKIYKFGLAERNFPAFPESYIIEACVVEKSGNPSGAVQS